MIKIEPLSGNILKLIAPEKLSARDFQDIAPHADAFIDQFGNVRLLIDASRLSGWENLDAFEHHMTFVKSHHLTVERIAVIVGHDWQQWVAALAGAFLHPKIRTFGMDEEKAALAWLTQQDSRSIG